jgi:hypothetical protein
MQVTYALSLSRVSCVLPSLLRGESRGEREGRGEGREGNRHTRGACASSSEARKRGVGKSERVRALVNSVVMLRALHVPHMY